MYTCALFHRSNDSKCKQFDKLFSFFFSPLNSQFTTSFFFFLDCLICFPIGYSKGYNDVEATQDPEYDL